MSDPTNRLAQVMEEFFAAHRKDPRLVEQGDRTAPWSVFYHERMLAWLEKMEPKASEPLRIAAACQHILRWQTPRENYPAGKLGYKKWRHDLALFHGDRAAETMQRAGYPEETIERVRDLLLKKDLRTDPETQVLEDVICLVFLENEFGAFAGKHDEEKVASVLRKTWKKMSPRGHEEAHLLAAGLPTDLLLLVQRALG